MGQNTGRAGICVDCFANLNVKAFHRRYFAERPDPPTPGVFVVEGARPGEETARKKRREKYVHQKRIKPG